MISVFSRCRFLFVILILSWCLLSGAPPAHATEQLTADDTNQTWLTGHSTASQGNVLWTDGDNVFFSDGATITSIQQRDNNVPALAGGVDTVFALGSGTAPGQVTAAWRRGNNGDYAWIWTNTGGGLVEVIDPTNPFDAAARHNPEAVSIADGRVFMVFQAFFNAQSVKHLFQINPATGAATNLTGVDPIVGVGRVNCGSGHAAWVLDPDRRDVPDDAPPLELWFFDGALPPTLVDTGELNAQTSLKGGRLLYAKTVSSVSQIFLYDSTLPRPAPVQLTSDITGENTAPLTDGHHAAWLHGNADGTNRSIILYGAVTLTRPESQPVDNAQLNVFREKPFQLQRGQLLWNDVSGLLRVEDGRSPTTDGFFSVGAVDIAPASEFNGSNSRTPWLADGFVSWIAPSTDGGTDREVFRFTGTPPSDAEQPLPPVLVLATPGDGQVDMQWDQILGATGYNLYRALEPGVTKENYASLLGGTKTTVFTNSTAVTGLANNRTHYFVVTALEGLTEGGNSREARATPFGAMWQAASGAPAVAFRAVAADPTDAAKAYAGHANGVYVSADGGLTWTSPTGDVVGKNVGAVAAYGPTVYAASTGDDLLRSTDSGGTWSVRASSTSAVGESNKSLAIDPAAPGTVYAGNFQLSSITPGDSYVIKTVNGGDTWSHLPEAPGFGNEIRAYAIAIAPSGTVYAGGTGTPNLVKSDTGGASWTDAGLPVPNYVYAIAVHPTTGGVVYAGTINNGVYRSTDAGASWTQKNVGLPDGPVRVNALVFDPDNPDLLYAGTDSGIYYTPDAGEHWAPRNDGFPAKAAPWINALDLTAGRRLITATESGIYTLDLTIENLPPAVSNPGTQQNAEGDSVLLQIAASDPDGDTLTYGAAGLPPNLTINSATGQISGLLPAGSAGHYDVTVTAGDGDLSGETTFVWTITRGGAGGTPGDLTGDGQVTAVDVQLVINEALGIATGFNADLNCDGVITAVDVQLVINAALGLPINPCP